MDSPATEPPEPASRLRKIELPWIILGALLLSTLVAAYQNARQLRAEATDRFNELVQGEQRAISREFRDFEDLMHGASALLVAVPMLTQSTWDAFFDARMPVPENYTGLIALQYVPSTPLTAGTAVPSVTKTAAVTERLTSVFTAVRPAQTIFLWRDIPEIADAMKIAETSHRMALSRKLPNIDGLPPMYSPVAMVIKVGDDEAARSLAGPRTPPRGFLIAIVDLNLLMSRVVQAEQFPITLELFDGDRPAFAPTGALTASTTPEMSVDAAIPIGQRSLKLHATSTPALEKKLQNNTPRTILLIGVLGAVLLGGLIWLLTRLREQAEALAAGMTRKLQDQTKFTENLIEFNPSPIFRKDAEGRFVSVNRAWEQLAGRRREDVLGKSYGEFQRPDVAAQNELLDRKLLASETGYEMAEAFIVNADDRQFETIIAKQVLRSSDGKVEGLIGTITDVTPIKRLERELAQQREQLNLVIRSSQQGIWDIELKEDGTAYYSPRFREILGYADGGFPARFNWQSATHPDDVLAFRNHMISHFKSETPLFDIESRVSAKSGDYIWVRTRAIAQRDSTGRAVRFVGSISDVTDRKEAEMKLVEANVRVTQAARAKESFLATMSHEIRTPLNGVLGMTSLLSETTLNDEQRDYIRLIRASGDTLLRLIDDVLDFSKIESGHMTLESVAIELVLVVEEAFELVAEKAREKDLALLFEMNEDVPFYVLGDATRLRQILLNLLANAIKFTARGEIKFTLTARRTAEGGIELEGQVRDTGIGIPADRASKLFQPFTQVDASTTRKYGGTGLGLAICKRLTQLMGGDIRAESVEGKGSVFIFTIQTQMARGPLKPYMQRDVFDFVGKRLLVVERNASRRPIQAARYARWGFDTIVVTPEEAEETFRRGPRFDVLVTDMVLPSPEAAGLQKALTEDDRERKTRGETLLPSILQSSVSRAELSSRGIKPPLRHDIFLIRPAGRARLFDVLMRAILHEPSHDIATRPFTSEPVYEREYQALLQSSPARPGPLASATQVTPARARATTAIQRGEFVLNALVAEDNEVNQRVVQGMLNNLGHQSTVVGDGRSAVERALAEEFDVILMDIHMPELDGVEAMREIREKLQGRKCPPIIAMTAHALSGDREHYLDAGMDDYLSKPIRSGELLKLLERVHSRTMAAPWAERGQVVAIPLSAAAAALSTPVAAAAAAAASNESAQSRVENVPVLDIEQLQDLRYLPSASGEATAADDPVGGLIRLFQTKAVERMELMEGMLARKDWHALSETAHSLRGASASMGFPRVALICKDMELGARALETDNANINAESVATLTNLLAQIKIYYAEADTALVVWLSSTSGASTEMAEK
ncbi:MAG: ATP-binding protein [Betaproteobacteria bacterium]